MVNISGIIIPSKWDANGNVVRMAIATQNEEEYFIKNDEAAAQLLSFLRQEVTVTGTLKIIGGTKIIKITTINKKMPES